MNISVTIMAHPNRKAQAYALFNQLLRQPFCDITITWDTTNNEWDTGSKALLSGINKGEWHVVIQDDAIITDNLYQHLINAISFCPTRTLISLYTGTARPLGSRIKAAVDKAKYCSWLRGYMLYWGVGILIPSDHIEPIIEYAKDREELYDVRIGVFYLQNRLPVFYTNPSLVDHDDNMSSLLNHGQGEEPRKAHHFVDGPVNWNKKFVDI